MKRVFTRSDFRKLCKICGRHGHEEEFCATSPVTITWYTPPIYYLRYKRKFLGNILGKMFTYVARSPNGRLDNKCIKMTKASKFYYEESRSSYLLGLLRSN